VAAAEKMGMDFPALVNRLVEVASARYFGTPSPPEFKVRKRDLPTHVFSYISENRDLMEKRLQKWCSFTSRTSDMVGRQLVFKELDKHFKEILLQSVPSLTNNKVACTWESRAGLKDGILIITQIDVPFDLHDQYQGYRKDPEWIFSEGIGSVWAPLTMLEFALRALRSCRKLRKIPLGVLCYADEGLDCRYSSDLIKEAIKEASQVIVLRPGNPGGRVITERRGQRKYFLVAEGRPQRLGKAAAQPEILRWVNRKLEELANLSNRRERIALSTVKIETQAYPMLLPHRVQATLLASYPTKKAGDLLEEKIREILSKPKVKWTLETVSDRPPMKTRKKGNPLLVELSRIAGDWEIPFIQESSVWPSVAGLVKPGKPVICGMGPSARDLNTAKECVERLSIIQRTLLLAQYLVTKVMK